jgi:uncharacterized membrane protein
MNRRAFHAVSLLALLYATFLLVVCIAVFGEYFWSHQYRGGAPILLAVIAGDKILRYISGVVEALLSAGTGIFASHPLTLLQYAVIAVVAGALIVSLVDVALLLTNLEQISDYVTTEAKAKAAAITLAAVNAAFATAYLGAYGIRKLIGNF